MVGNMLRGITTLVTAIAVSAVVTSSEAQAPDARLTPASVLSTTITPEEWSAYRDRFIASTGRVVDIEKNEVSHSEGQGYGMLLAVRADDQATFDLVLNFTLDHMRGRSDGLISWLYNPHTYPQIVDSNNASDGDVLIAYALVTAAAKWNEARYIAIAQPMVEAIGELLLEERNDIVRVKPAAFGFEPRQHEDGPVVNLSYYIYGAFLMFAAIDDRHPWLKAWQSGLRLTEASKSGRLRLTPDWITLRRDRFLQPARGFAAKSSYDAVRVPLYMALGGRVPSRYFEPFDRAWNINGNRAPMDFDLSAETNLMDMNDPGYRAIAAIAACANRGVPLPGSVRRFQVKSYFSSSLHLLALSAVRAHYPQCLQQQSLVATNTIVTATGGYVVPRGN